MTQYDNLTQEDFDRILNEKLESMRASELIGVPGIYEIVAEYYNNDILEQWESEQQEVEDDE